MKKVLQGLRKPSNWLAALPILFFFVIVSTGLVSQNTIAIITNGLDIGGAVLLTFALLPAWIETLRRRGPSPEAYLFGGILLIVNSVAASRLWSWAIIAMGKPSWMINHWFQSFCYLMIGVGIFYLLKIPGEGRASSMRYIAYGLVLAVIAMVLFLLYQEY